MYQDPRFRIAENSIILMATTTPEKVRDMNLQCEAHKIPLRFYPIAAMNETTHSPEEDAGSFDGNADKKLRSAVNAIIHAHNGNPTAFWNSWRELNHCCTVDEAKRKEIIVACEDSGFSFNFSHNPDILNKFLKHFDATGVEEHIHKLEKQMQDPKKFSGFPGVETAGFLRDCGGAAAFFKRVRDAAEKTGLNIDQLTVESFSTMKMIRIHKNAFTKKTSTKELGVKEHPQRETTGFSPTLVYSKKINSKMSPTPLPRTVNDLDAHAFTSDHFLRPLSVHSGSLTAAQIDMHNLSFVLNHSPRSKMIRELTKDMKLPEKNFHSEEKKEKMHVALILPNKDPTGNAHLLEKHLQANGAAKEFCVDKYEDDFPHPEELHNDKKADAIVFTPLGKNTTPAQIAQQLFLLSSLVVDKQLSIRSFDKPIIILNSDGSWDAPIHALRDLMQRRMMGGFINESGNKPFDPRAFIEVRTKPEEVVDYLHDKHKSYMRLTTPILPNNGRMKLQLHGENPITIEACIDKPSRAEVYGKDSPCERNVAIFCSASSEHSMNLKMTSELSYTLAKSGRGVVCGGGDRYMMGAINKGIKDWRRDYKESYADNPNYKDAWFAGSSTPIILGRETESGEIPKDFDQFYLAPDIYRRMQYMSKKSDAFIVLEGGPGTVQEATYLIAKRLHESAHSVSYKPIIFCNSALHGESKGCWDNLLKALVGKHYNERLVPQDIDKLHALGLYIVNDTKQAMQLIDTLCPVASQGAHINLNEKHNKPDSNIRGVNVNTGTSLRTL